MSITSLPASGTDLLISEKFVSLQGEGISQGAPAAFLRLGNCNLACSYCDTPYTWDANRYDLKSELQAETLQSVAHWICQNAPGRLIITGGEPLLQQKQLIPLLKRVDAMWANDGREPLVIEVETNGTIAPLAALVDRIDQWNVSPKLSTSGETRERRQRQEPISLFSKLDHAYFKFVITSEDDLEEIEQLLVAHSLPKTRALLMPEARTEKELKERAGRVAHFALEKNYRYSGRLHLELYGGKRGT